MSIRRSKKDFKIDARKHGFALFILLTGFAVSSIGAQTDDTSTLRFGTQSGWKDFPTVSGIGYQKNKEGFLEMTLSPAEYRADERTDLLVHFDHGLLKDEARRYTFGPAQGVVTRSFAAIGDGSATFRGDAGLAVRALPGQGMFAPDQVWSDFSIEFWLFPTQIQDGEVVFFWKGGRTSASAFQTQIVQASFRNSKLQWTFQNLFAPTPREKAITLSLSGDRTIVPKRWHHHLVRFQSKIGLLEYLLDGKTEAIVYATASGREEPRVFQAVTGPQTNGEIELGPSLTGAIDELRISREAIETPQQDRYAGTLDPSFSSPAKGVAISRIFDLGQPGSTVERIKIRSNREGDTAAVFSYRMADAVRYQWTLSGETRKSLSRSDAEDEDSWIRFAPGSPPKLAPGSKVPAGRFLQLRIDLLPSGTGVDTPRVQEITVDYVKNVPPPPPTGIELIAGNGKIEVRWKPVTQGQVDGYMVFFGVRPGQYLQTKSNQGSSPIDVGAVKSFVLDGLTNDQIYYVSVVSYQSIEQPGSTSPIKNLSVNSRESSTRPQRTLP